jgi:LysM repeat protein
MSDYSGKSSEYIEHLEEIWDRDSGFENFLYNYRISIRLLENLELPTNCKPSKKTHTVIDGQTLYRLSVIYGVSVENIQTANNLGAGTQINSGSILVIP